MIVIYNYLQFLQLCKALCIRYYYRHGTLVYLGTAMYAFEGVAVLLPVEDLPRS